MQAKLYYITFARLPTEKAHGLQIAKMCEAFTQIGARVSLISPRRKNSITDSLHDYYALTTPFQHHYTNTPDVTSWFTPARSWQHYLHLLCFGLTTLFLPLPKEVIVFTRTEVVALIAGWRGRTVVYEAHAWPKRGSRLHAWLIKRAALIVCNSEGTEAACHAHGLKHTMVAHNGFDETLLTDSTTQADARNKLELPKDKKIVMYIGSLQDWKGVDTLCEAAALLPDDHLVVVIGGGVDEVARWQARYPQVRFLGQRPYHELSANQRAADVLVVPNNPASVESEQYTSPIKLFAHLASGVPVVVSDLPTTRAIVSDREVRFFTPGDASELADAISDSTKNFAELHEQCVRARSLVSQYTWSMRAKSIINTSTDRHD